MTQKLDIFNENVAPFLKIEIDPKMVKNIIREMTWDFLSVLRFGEIEILGFFTKKDGFRGQDNLYVYISRFKNLENVVLLGHDKYLKIIENDKDNFCKTFKISTEIADKLIKFNKFIYFINLHFPESLPSMKGSRINCKDFKPNAFSYEDNTMYLPAFMSDLVDKYKAIRKEDWRLASKTKKTVKSV